LICCQVSGPMAFEAAVQKREVHHRLAAQAREVLEERRGPDQRDRVPKRQALHHHHHERRRIVSDV